MISSESASRRRVRLAEAFKKELSEIFLKDIQHPKLRSITVTQVEFDPLMQMATIKVCKMMTGEFGEIDKVEEKEILKALNSARSFVFSKLRRSLSLRFMPDLQFKYDRSLAEASLLWSKMNAWSREQKPEVES
jgi:ribosome-binding factor A